MLKKWLPVVLLVIIGCQERGGYRDFALVQDAARNLKGVRNNLEEYKVDYGTYPGKDANLKEALSPYFLKVRFSEGKDAPINSANVTYAGNQLSQINNLLDNFEREVESRMGRDTNFISDIKPHLENIRSVLRVYLSEIEAKPSEEKLGIDIDEEFNSIHELMEGLKLDSLRDSSTESLIGFCPEVELSLKSFGNELKKAGIDTVLYREVGDKIDGIERTFDVYKANLKGKSVAGAQIVQPEREIEEIESTLKNAKVDTSLLSSLEIAKTNLQKYRMLETERDDAIHLLQITPAVTKAHQIMDKYDKTLKGKVKLSAKFLKAQITLRKMGDALEEYRKKNGSYPGGGTELEPILHPYFIEETMTGEKIDRWEGSLSYLSEKPTYSTEDSLREFMLSARVANEKKSPIFCGAQALSEWKNMVSHFSEGPFYTTIDSTNTYFLVARAKDSGKTIVTERPTITR